MGSRKQSIEDRIEELNEYLVQWEEHRLTANNPAEIRKSNNEINRIKALLEEYHDELVGKGDRVEEDLDNPIIGPALRKNNIKWIAGIGFSIVLLILGYFIFDNVTKTVPDYDQYLAFLEEGNKLIEANKFEEAQIAYEKALEFYPQDTAVARKVDLLRQANDMVKEEKFEEAKNLFKLIINVPTTSALEFKKDNPTDVNNATSSNQLQITIEWNGLNLMVTINGGVPFDDPSAPYKFNNLDCEDCVQWENNEGVYTGQIEGTKLAGLTLTISDSVGNQGETNIPKRANSETNSPEKEEEEKPEEPAVKEAINRNLQKEKFEGLVASADKYFETAKYSKAKQDYTAALQLKNNDSYVKKRLAECEDKLSEEELANAKRILNMPIKGGTFSMGFKDGFPEERPIHDVTLKSFKIAKYEVTVAQYKAFCKFTAREMPPAPPFGWNDSYPMTNVTWEEALAFCNWVGGRLPTEAEWEYAARDGGGKATYSGGNDLNSLAIYSDNSTSRPKGVGAKRPNGFQLYDMTGNASEWCMDWYSKYKATPISNPKGPNAGKYKILRGGAYNSTATSTQDGDQLRVTYRNSRKPGTRAAYIGFRVAW